MKKSEKRKLVKSLANMAAHAIRTARHDESKWAVAHAGTFMRGVALGYKLAARTVAHEFRRKGAKL